MRRFALLFALLGLLCLAAPAQSLTIATAPPTIETAITAGPDDGSQVVGDVAFSFAATRDGMPFPDAVFRCTLDGGAPLPCSSPVTFEELEEGPHDFTVAAEDPLTQASDPEPAHRAFDIAEPECEEEVAAEEGLGGDEESEGDEEEACEAEGSGALPPRACLLRTARATVAAGGERARISLRYTAYSPTDATVTYRFGGGRTGPRLVDVRRHLARRGVIRLSQKLSAGEAARVRAARRFTVEIDIPGAPEACARYDLRHLSAKAGGGSYFTWMQTGSVFGGR